MAANAKIFAGSLVCLDAGQRRTGRCRPPLRRAVSPRQVDNTGGAAGIKHRNPPGCIPARQQCLGRPDHPRRHRQGCFIVDDQTVAKTSTADTRSVAGVVRDVDGGGVGRDLRSSIQMIINQQNLRNLFIGYRAAFQNAFAGVHPDFNSSC